MLHFGNIAVGVHLARGEPVYAGMQRVGKLMGDHVVPVARIYGVVRQDHHVLAIVQLQQRAFYRARDAGEERFGRNDHAQGPLVLAQVGECLNMVCQPLGRGLVLSQGCSSVGHGVGSKCCGSLSENGNANPSGSTHR